MLTSINKRLRTNGWDLDWKGPALGETVAAQPDYSRAALARFIEFVVAKGLVHPATAQGWRVATTKVLEELSPAERADVRTIDVETTFKQFLNRYPGRLSPASVGEYRRRVGRAIQEFVRWMEDPGSYAFEASRGGRTGGRRSLAAAPADARGRPASESPVPAAARSTDAPAAGAAFPPPLPGMALDYPLRADTLARVVVPRDLTVDEARRMGAFLLTLAVDFRPAGSDR